MILTDPYLIALCLFELNKDIIDVLKNQLSEKKICQYFKNKIPYCEILYSLTGGNEIWNDEKLNLKWDEDKALRIWKDELDDLIEECSTIYDLMIVFYYFKNQFIISNPENFNEFLIKIE